MIPNWCHLRSNVPSHSKTKSNIRMGSFEQDVRERAHRDTSPVRLPRGAYGRELARCHVRYVPQHFAFMRYTITLKRTDTNFSTHSGHKTKTYTPPLASIQSTVQNTTNPIHSVDTIYKTYHLSRPSSRQEPLGVSPRATRTPPPGPGLMMNLLTTRTSTRIRGWNPVVI